MKSISLCAQRAGEPAHTLVRAGLKAGLLLPFLLLVSLTTQAFDLTDLQQQIQQAPVVRGQFVQEKHIRGLAQPLISRGNFCLAGGQGLLWNLSAPVARNLRITEDGLAYRSGSEWRMEGAQGGRQSRLFLAVLRGDSAELQKQFALALTGNGQDWQLTLSPKSRILQQIFTRIQISGATLVSMIELSETSGERTVIKLVDAAPDTRLTAEEVQAFD